jgi:hypothetical protein
MTDVNTLDIKAIADRLFFQAQREYVRVTMHAHQEMVEEDIVLDDVLRVLHQARVVENYPEHKRGPCCLVHGQNSTGRDLHVVCTTSLDIATIITVYEPKPPKWKNPFTRGRTE